jgi:23S rRNA (uracil1939-C5)-methyltransferase
MNSASVAIEKLAFGGSGVGRLDGKVCVVPYSCPGDLVEVRVTNEKRSYLNAEIARMISPSESRVTPVCPLFGSCGGCNWQHIGYAGQLAAKRQIFAETMWRGARVEHDVIGEVVPSDMQYGYRSRVQFKLHGRNGRMQIGFFSPGYTFCGGCFGGLPCGHAGNQCRTEEPAGCAGVVFGTGPIPQINIDCAEHGVVAIVNYIGDDSRAAGDFFNGCRNLLSELTALYLQTGRKHTMVRVFGMICWHTHCRQGQVTVAAWRSGQVVFLRSICCRIASCWNWSERWPFLMVVNPCSTCIAATVIFLCHCPVMWLL